MAKGTIETDTAILPYIVADAVLREAGLYLERELPRCWSELLADRAERHYAQRTTYYKGIRRKDGLAYCYCFMRHWAAALIGQELGIRMPAEFCNGQQIQAAR